MTDKRKTQIQKEHALVSNLITAVSNDITSNSVYILLTAIFLSRSYDHIFFVDLTFYNVHDSNLFSV